MRYQYFQDWLVKKNNVTRLYKYIYNDSHGDKGNKKAAQKWLRGAKHFKILIDYWQHMKRKQCFYHEKLQRLGPYRLTIKRYSDATHA